MYSNSNVNITEGFKKFKQVVENICELEGKKMEIIHSDKQKVKRRKRSKLSLRLLWDTIKNTNIHMEVSETEEIKKWE